MDRESAGPSSPRRGWRGALVLFSLVSLFYTAAGMLSGRVLLPLDLLSDLGPWKSDPIVPHAVSNRLLSDVVLQFVPWDLAVRRHLRAREMPWSNPLQGDGAPLFANPQVALLSPFTWLRLALAERGWAFAVFLKLLVLGLGIRWAALELGTREPAARFSGVVAIASGMAIVWAHYPITNVLAFLPWLLASSLRLTRSTTPSSTAAVVLFAALATGGGHPETLFVGVVSIAVYLAMGVREGGIAAARAQLRVMAAAAAGFLLTAVQVGTFLALLPGSHVLHSRSQAASSGFRGMALTGLVVPGILGSPLPDEIDVTDAVSHEENFNMRNGAFVGALCLLCLLLAYRDLRPALRRGLVIGAISLLVSLSLPGLRDAIRLLPFSGVVAIQYWAVPFVLFASLAAGEAVERVAAGPIRRGPGLVLVVGGTLAVCLGLLVFLPALRPTLLATARTGIERLRAQGTLHQETSVYETRLNGYLDRGRITVVHRLAVPAFFWTLGGIALLSKRRRRVLLMGAAAGELLSFGYGYLPSVPFAAIPGEPAAIRDLRHLDPDCQFLLAGTDAYPPNLATLHGVRDIRSYDVLESENLIRRLESAQYDASIRAFPASLSAGSVARLAGFGVRFFVSRDAVPGCARVGGASPPAVGLYELPGAVAQRWPANTAPCGLAASAALSVLGALLAASLVVLAARKPSTAETPATAG